MRFKDVLGLPAQGNQYKGNLHSHTVCSDGHLTPEEAVHLYQTHGYSFLCLSEHDLYTDHRAALSDSEFLILPGLEASAMLLDKKTGLPLKVHHMNGILGTEDMQAKAAETFFHGQKVKRQDYAGQWNGLEAGQKLCDLLRNHGCFVTYNHPIWSRVEPSEFLELKGISALEIFNYDTVNESGTGADTTYWDQMLRHGKRVFCFASDDNHNNGEFEDSCGGWVCVVAPELTHEAILHGLIAGDFYASSGPEIYGWGVKDDQVWVSCSDCERVNLIAGGFINAGKTLIAPEGETLRHVEFPLRGDETYVRLECIARDGRTAWTNAIFPER